MEVLRIFKFFIPLECIFIPPLLLYKNFFKSSKTACKLHFKAQNKALIHMYRIENDTDHTSSCIFPGLPS